MSRVVEVTNVLASRLLQPPKTFQLFCGGSWWRTDEFDDSVIYATNYLSFNSGSIPGGKLPFFGTFLFILNALGSVENNVTLYEILPKRNLHSWKILHMLCLDFTALHISSTLPLEWIPTYLPKKFENFVVHSSRVNFIQFPK